MPAKPVKLPKEPYIMAGPINAGVLMDGAKALVMTGIDVLLNPDLRERMKDEFAQTGERTSDGAG